MHLWDINILCKHYIPFNLWSPMRNRIFSAPRPQATQCAAVNTYYWEKIMHIIVYYSLKYVCTWKAIHSHPSWEYTITFWLMSEPPQNWKPRRRINATFQGNSYSLASSPPTILSPSFKYSVVPHFSLFKSLSFLSLLCCCWNMGFWP